MVLPEAHLDKRALLRLTVNTESCTPRLLAPVDLLKISP
jgi:hypothetical protein